jgi:hypothetical protein
MAAKHRTSLEAVFCRMLCRSTGVCRRSPTEGVNPGAVRYRTRERRHIAPRSRILLIKTRVPVSAETVPFHLPRRLLLFLANPSRSYNPFAFESKRTWDMRKKKKFSPIFRFRLCDTETKGLNSFCNNELNSCFLLYCLLWRSFLSVPSSWMFNFICRLIHWCLRFSILIHVLWTLWRST